MRAFLLVFLLTGPFSLTQVKAATGTGRNAAMKYFTGKSRAPASVPSTSGSVRAPSPVISGPIRELGERSLGVHMGSLVQSNSHNWLGPDLSGWGVSAQYMNAEAGVFASTYELDLQKFSNGERELTKLAFLYHLSFPRRLSFPVYLGVGVGPGYFFRQERGYSEFSLDYKAYAGLRLHNDFGQYFLQAGVKNHIHVLDSGQFIGWFISSGVAYSF